MKPEMCKCYYQTLTVNEVRLLFKFKFKCHKIII